MAMMRERLSLMAATALLVVAAGTTARASIEVPSGTPGATIDLATPEGVRMVQGQWRYSDTRIVEVGFRSPGPDRKPSGPPNRTYDIEPRAGALEFDDSAWEVVDPTKLMERRSTGRVSFNWYRMRVTIPERIGSFDPTGSTVVFETVVDDYAEVWVDGKLPRELGQSGGSLVKGWNAPNRLVIGRDVKPGQAIQLAVFGINGPLSDPPPNYIWVRSAKLEFHKLPRRVAPRELPAEVERVDPALDGIIPSDARIEKLAEGFQFTEGPVWHPDGYLLFSDPNRNRIYQWSPDGGLSVFREMSGYSGADIDEYRQPGSNGLTLDREGRLTINEHGNRRVTRLEPDGRLTVLADRYEGKRLNSPNDLVYHSDGSLYFTDPPFGLPKAYDDPRKELPYSGVFRLHQGKLQRVSKELKGPNGLAFSPDERFLYVGNWDTEKKIVTRYPVKADGTLGSGEVFFDMGGAPGEEALDGLKVDQRGNLYVSGPGGVWIISSEGKHLGTIRAPELPANFAWGDADGRTLYMTARTGLYRMRLHVPGIRPADGQTGVRAAQGR
jgi:gluconolactonase